MDGALPSQADDSSIDALLAAVLASPGNVSKGDRFDTWPCALAAETSHNPLGDHMEDYIHPKVHHIVRERRWQLIIVTGKYARRQPYVISNNEKNDKVFNWHRPTARILSEHAVEIACFPGRDYIQHYAVLLATYARLMSWNDTTVRYQRYPDLVTTPITHDSNLEWLGHADTVVIGYVDAILRHERGHWERGPICTNDIFAWQKQVCRDGTTIAFLGCMPSFWGDISIQIVRALATRGVRAILYIGKAGTLNPEVRPNQCIATGSASLVNGELVRWTDVLRDHSNTTSVKRGVHTNTKSPLLNEYPPARSHKGISLDWIDCEVGLMGRECNAHGLGFGYLHIVSDNLSTGNDYGLWNERLGEVQRRRQRLLAEISGILDVFLLRPAIQNPHAYRDRRLNSGADVDAQGGEYGNALQAASLRGHERVVRLLLDSGADVNAQGGEYGNVLQAAPLQGHETVVRLLIEK